MSAYETEQLALAQMETGQIGTVVEVLGGQGLVRRLEALGIRPVFRQPVLYDLPDTPWRNNFLSCLLQTRRKSNISKTCYIKVSKKKLGNRWKWVGLRKLIVGDLVRLIFSKSTQKGSSL
jgi:hypothetical protein